MQSSKLRSHQVAPVRALLDIFSRHNSAVDLSDCGVGKCYSSTCVALELGLPTLVICPKTVCSSWHRAAEHFGDTLSVINYEKIRTGTTPYGHWEGRKPAPALLKCTSCQCIIGEDSPPCYAHAEGVHCVENKKGRKVRGRFVFAPEIKFLILDELHRCGSLKSDNAELMIAARRQNIKTLALSATPGTTPLQLRALGYLLDLHQLTNFFQWAGRHGCRPHPIFKGLHWMVGAEKQKEIMARIRDQIIPERGVRVTVDGIPNFPESDVQAVCYDLDEAGKIDECYAEMSEALARHEQHQQSDKMPELPLTMQLRARQKIELLKTPVLVELAEDFLAKGLSVALFVSFKETIAELRKRLHCDCVIDGSPEGVKNRQASIDAFQANESRVIICNSEAGGVGVSLQDLTGEHPRAGLASPPLSAVTLRQLLGRLRRDGGKSRSLYRIVFVAGSVEEGIQKALQGKLDCLDSLTDGDLTMQQA